MNNCWMLYAKKLFHFSKYQNVWINLVQNNGAISLLCQKKKNKSSVQWIYFVLDCNIKLSPHDWVPVHPFAGITTPSLFIHWVHLFSLIDSSINQFREVVSSVISVYLDLDDIIPFSFFQYCLYITCFLSCSSYFFCLLTSVSTTFLLV